MTNQRGCTTFCRKSCIATPRSLTQRPSLPSGPRSLLSWRPETSSNIFCRRQPCRPRECGARRASGIPAKRASRALAEPREAHEDAHDPSLHVPAVSCAHLQSGISIAVEGFIPCAVRLCGRLYLHRRDHVPMGGIVVTPRPPRIAAGLPSVSPTPLGVVCEPPKMQSMSTPRCSNPRLSRKALRGRLDLRGKVTMRGPRSRPLKIECGAPPSVSG